MLDGEPAAPKERGSGPNFWPMYVVAKQSPILAIGCIKMPLGTKVGLGSGDIVLDGDPAAPHFTAHVYCGQMAGWIRMPLGMEVGLDPGHIVLDGNPAPFLLWRNGWMDHDAT